MWIKPVRAYLLPLLCALLLGSPATSQAEQGQYRSKILLTPGGAMDKGAELSIDELEQQIGSIEQPYAKSSAGRHLARHYVEQGEYGKAIEYYQEALAAKGLSDIANREMLRELAQVYLLKEDFAAAAQTLDRVLAIDLVPDVSDYLLLAQAQYRRGRYVAVVDALDRIGEKGLTLNAAQMRQALALYYRAGAYSQSEALLKSLLELEPADTELWHQLVSVYLQQNKRRQALDQLALARRKSIAFTERDILLLVDLQAVNKNPYDAADILQQALAQGEVKATGASYRKLFEFWYQAREPERAQQALQKAARLTGDTELYLYLAQLQMDQRAWQPMHETMLAACTEQLEDKFVGRANLLLGVSQLKLGSEQGARRSFINATLIGGVNAQAGQWLDFMKAEPATEDEARRIVGICHGERDKRMDVADARVSADLETAGASEPAQQDFQVKTVKPMRLYYSEFALPLDQLAEKMQSLVTRMGVTLLKSGGSVDGPLHIISFAAAPDELQLALPSRGSPQGRGKYKVRSTKAFKCAYLEYEGPPAGLLDAWLAFAPALEAAGFELSGERRALFSDRGGSQDSVKVELQAGIE